MPCTSGPTQRAGKGWRHGCLLLSPFLLLTPMHRVSRKCVLFLSAKLKKRHFSTELQKNLAHYKITYLSIYKQIPKVLGLVINNDEMKHMSNALPLYGQTPCWPPWSLIFFYCSGMHPHVKIPHRNFSYGHTSFQGEKILKLVTLPLSSRNISTC